MIAANPASAPVDETNLWIEMASGIDPMGGLSLRGDPGARRIRREPSCGQLRHAFRQPCGVPLKSEEVDLRERLLDPRWIERVAVGADDLLRRGGLRPLVGVEQILME